MPPHSNQNDNLIFIIALNEYSTIACHILNSACHRDPNAHQALGTGIPNQLPICSRPNVPASAYNQYFLLFIFRCRVIRFSSFGATVRVGVVLHWHLTLNGAQPCQPAGRRQKMRQREKERKKHLINTNACIFIINHHFSSVCQAHAT